MKIRSYDTIVIGTGAAGYATACRLKEQKIDVAIVTEGVMCGTSRNTGSDKQTYYKLALAGDRPDSVRTMAQNLFDGGCVDGDTALCEAALSARCFLNLCELGVPFPTNRYGEYVGYQTDHDLYGRATSAGPLTSQMMTEVLQKQAEHLEIRVFDGYYAVRILKNGERVCGVLCVKDGELCAFRCANLVLATGGPAGIYADSVYPICHTGSSGLAIQAGATMQNLSLWQYGLASVAPRWNVSGTYMQVLPRFVSVDEQGREHDFLWEAFEDCYEGLSLVFLKGYQWPFDPKKAEHGSSQIDLLIHRERVEKKRRVYLDFTKNPFDLEFSKLSEEACSYLKQADADFGTPIQRLAKMNTPAIELYKGKGVDLSREYLEIALCAQHCNGGVAVDAWWQTSVKGLFAVGECAGTHGISRPGGSALNAGQVGALRIAQYLSKHSNEPTSEELFSEIVSNINIPLSTSEQEAIRVAQRRMSDCAAAVRDSDQIKAYLQETLAKLNCAKDPKYRDVLLTQAAVLTAMVNPISDPNCVQEVTMTEHGFCVSVRPVRPIPEADPCFETVWRGYREHQNVF
ncbi:MAG: FAD-binding protein [Oscillospiraceae bacterium]|nr:FAD-binding protein [Oscillospiraceae bacterium]